MTELVAQMGGRVAQGEVSERSLARLLGVSQPHIHLVLKGRRKLSLEMADRVLRRLGMTVTSLQPGVVGPSESGSVPPWRAVPVLAHTLGPGSQWPAEPRFSGTCNVPTGLVASLACPAVVRLTPDPNMAPLLSDGGWAVVDLSLPARSRLQAELLYAVELDDSICVRWLRWRGRDVYAVAVDALATPAQWRVLPTTPTMVALVVRAQVFVLPVGLTGAGGETRTG